MRKRRQAGFTLIELMVALAVFAILVAVAVPNFRTTIENNRRSTTVQGLLGALQLARSEAIKRGNPVSVCAADPHNADSCGTDWSSGLLVFSDLDGDGSVTVNTSSSVCDDDQDCIVRVTEPVASGISYASTPADAVTYLASGLVADTAAFTIAIDSCTSTNAKRARKVSIGITGTVDVEEAKCA